MTLGRRAGIVAGTCLAYWFAYALDDLLFSFLSFTDLARWVYLPSGIRLISVLLFGRCAAFGIFIAVLLLCLNRFFPGDWLSSCVTAAIAAASPLLTRAFARRWLGIGADLRGLSAKRLLQLSVLCALINSLMQHAGFSWRGHSDDFLLEASVHTVGNIAGSFIVLYSIRFALRLFERVTLGR